MNPFFCFHDCFCRIIKRKKTLLCLLLLFLCSSMCGILFINSPSFYDYHLRICDRFLDRVCYSQTSVFLIFVRRTAGHCFILALIFISGVHPAACVFTPIALIYRGYTFGGCIYIFFRVYRFSGAIVALVLYIPIHLMIDAVLIMGGGLAFSRAGGFRFCKSDGRELLIDFLLFVAIIAAVCLLEAVLLLAFFHPFGNVI